MTTSTRDYPARSILVDVAHLDALHTDLLARRPFVAYDDAPVAHGGIVTEAYQRYLDWAAVTEPLTAELHATIHRLVTARILCRRCEGHGSTRFRWRTGGVCYSCHGSGFTARERARRAADHG